MIHTNSNIKLKSWFNYPINEILIYEKKQKTKPHQKHTHTPP